MNRKSARPGAGGNFASGSLSISVAAMNQHYTQLGLPLLPEGVAKLLRIAAAGASKEEKE